MDPTGHSGCSGAYTPLSSSSAIARGCGAAQSAGSRGIQESHYRYTQTTAAAALMVPNASAGRLEAALSTMNMLCCCHLLGLRVVGSATARTPSGWLGGGEWHPPDRLPCGAARFPLLCKVTVMQERPNVAKVFVCTLKHGVTSSSSRTLIITLQLWAYKSGVNLTTSNLKLMVCIPHSKQG